MRVIQGIGMVLFMLGAFSMDSESQLIPAAVTLTGICLVWLTNRYETE